MDAISSDDTIDLLLLLSNANSVGAYMEQGPAGFRFVVNAYCDLNLFIWRL